MITYTWSFPSLGVVFNEDNLTNVIQDVHWTLTAVDGKYATSCYSSIGLPAPSPDLFIPYDQVTEAQVQQWTIGALGQEQVDSMMASLASQIEAQKNPTGGNLPPPWVQP